MCGSEPKPFVIVPVAKVKKGPSFRTAKKIRPHYSYTSTYSITKVRGWAGSARFARFCGDLHNNRTEIVWTWQAPTQSSRTFRKDEI